MRTKTGKAKHVIVISYDAFSEDNWELACKLPNMSSLVKNGTFSTRLKSVYPTLTYVVHSTIVTGVYPDKHGIYHNNPLQPFVREEDQDWFWYRKDINVPTIYDAVKDYNLKSAGILWPVTGKASINYNIPEIRAIGNENQALKILKNGTPFYSMSLEIKYGRVRKGIEQPYLDNFTSVCTVDTIIKKKPNLFLVHLIDLDDTKHVYGTDSKEVEETIIRMDKRLGDIISATEEAGIKEDTVFLIVGDHGQMNVNFKVKLNLLLKEKGLIYEEQGEMIWRAFVQSAGGSAYLHIKDGDEEAEKLALEVLEHAMKDERYGIECMYSRIELDNFHVEKTVQYMVEAKTGYSFDDSLDGDSIVVLKKKGIRYATHGYSPDKEKYKCNLVISGNSIKKGYEIGDIEMVDIAPTIGKILGINFNNCDGRVLDEIFQ